MEYEDMAAMVEMGICEPTYPLTLRIKHFVNNVRFAFVGQDGVIGWNPSAGGFHYRRIYLCPTFVGISKETFMHVHETAHVYDFGIVYLVLKSTREYNLPRELD
jgi:hypothetical protein